VVGSSSLIVPPQTGDFVFAGGNVNLSGKGLQQARGLSATEKPAHNLRGINVAVTQGQTGLQVESPVPETDAEYAVSVTPSWMANTWVPAKGPEGFTVQFGTAAPAGAKVDWIIVR
jgi:hypothetical protein